MLASSSQSNSMLPIKNNKQSGDNGDKTTLTSCTDSLVDKACQTCRDGKVKCNRQWPKCGRCISRNVKCPFEELIPIERQSTESLGLENERTNGLEKRIAKLEVFIQKLSINPTLSRVPPRIPTFHKRRSSDASELAESIRHNFVLGAESTTSIYDFVRSQSDVPLTLSRDGDFLSEEEASDIEGVEIIGKEIGERSIDWRLALPELGRALSIHLIDAFFVSCCGGIRLFEIFHPRLDFFRANVGALGPANQVLMCSFVCMGSRASPHSALLGIPIQDPTIASDIAAGVRRERACRALSNQAIDMYSTLELAYDPTIANLEVALVLAQMYCFVELNPRKSRMLISIALGQFKDIQDSDVIPQSEKEIALLKLAGSLFTTDAVIAAYAKKPSFITESDLRYFTGVVSIPDFKKESLALILDSILVLDDANDDMTGDQRDMNDLPTRQTHVTHDSINAATTILDYWLAQSQREFGRIASATWFGTSSLRTGIRILWSAVDQIHSSVQGIQQTLVNIDYTPLGCQLDDCVDQHLRSITRLDRNLFDVTHLLHSFITALKIKEENQALQNWDLTSLTFDRSQWSEYYRESERRVRKCLKLVAFYAQLYITSVDLHMAYHLFFQLELLPNWAEMVLQRYGESDGPETEDLEVSETEIDWLLKGLKVASFYHPCAERRIFYFLSNRRRARDSYPR